MAGWKRSAGVGVHPSDQVLQLTRARSIHPSFQERGDRRRRRNPQPRPYKRNEGPLFNPGNDYFRGPCHGDNQNHLEIAQVGDPAPDRKPRRLMEPTIKPMKKPKIHDKAQL